MVDSRREKAINPTRRCVLNSRRGAVAGAVNSRRERDKLSILRDGGKKERMINSTRGWVVDSRRG